MKNSELISYAINSLENAYAPYSEFKVGAALLCENRNVYTGCNVENASFSATNCAERTAFFKAISEGERAFIKIAVVAFKNGKINEYISPCGVCRQVMAEFCTDDFEIVLAKSTSDYVIYKLSDLLPNSFSSKNLGE